jgi:hypothetical protein
LTILSRLIFLKSEGPFHDSMEWAFLMIDQNRFFSNLRPKFPLKRDV